MWKIFGNPSLSGQNYWKLFISPIKKGNAQLKNGICSEHKSPVVLLRLSLEAKKEIVARCTAEERQSMVAELGNLACQSWSRRARLRSKKGDGIGHKRTFA